jgi:hypothetical protein
MPVLDGQPGCGKLHFMRYGLPQLHCGGWYEPPVLWSSALQGLDAAHRARETNMHKDTLKHSSNQMQCRACAPGRQTCSFAFGSRPLSRTGPAVLQHWLLGGMPDVAVPRCKILTEVSCFSYQADIPQEGHGHDAFIPARPGCAVTVYRDRGMCRNCYTCCPKPAHAICWYTPRFVCPYLGLSTTHSCCLNRLLRDRCISAAHPSAQQQSGKYCVSIGPLSSSTPATKVRTWESQDWTLLTRNVDVVPHSGGACLIKNLLHGVRFPLDGTRKSRNQRSEHEHHLEHLRRLPSEPPRVQ